MPIESNPLSPSASPSASRPARAPSAPCPASRPGAFAISCVISAGGGTDYSLARSPLAYGPSPVGRPDSEFGPQPIPAHAGAGLPLWDEAEKAGERDGGTGRGTRDGGLPRTRGDAGRRTAGHRAHGRGEQDGRTWDGGFQRCWIFNHASTGIFVLLSPSWRALAQRAESSRGGRPWRASCARQAG